MQSINVGADIGHYSSKFNGEFSIISKVTKNSLGVLDKDIYHLMYDTNDYYVGRGSFEPNLNKIKKDNLIPLLLTGLSRLAINKQSCFNLVVGLPINLYKDWRTNLKEKILEHEVTQLTMEYQNIRQEKTIIINNCTVYPECVGAYYSIPNKFNSVIIVDIGGLTTDIAYIKKGSLIDASTVVVGTINILSKIQEYINSKYALNIDINKADDVLTTNRLMVDNEEVNLSFTQDILEDNFNKIKEDLNLNYPVRTEPILLIGGGANYFEKIFKKHYANSEKHFNNIYANSKGFLYVANQLSKGEY